MLQRWSRLVSERPRHVLAGTFVLTLAAFLQLVDVRAAAESRWPDALRLEIDPSLDSLLPSEDEGRAYYERIRKVFDNDETLLLTIHSPQGVFTPDFLAALQRATERIESEEAVATALSLANASNIRSVDGALDTGGFYDDAPEGSVGADQVRSALRRNPIYRGSLVSDDENAAAILVYLFEVPEREFTQAETDFRLRDIVADEFEGVAEVSLTGNPHAKAETSRTLVHDLLRIVPLAFVAAIVISFFFFRTLRGTVVPSLTIAIALIWTLSIATLVDPRINVVTISVPALILVVGLAYAMHIVSAYYAAVGSSAAARPGGAVRAALEHVALPTLLTGITTGAGFFSLTTSPIEAVRHFGMHCGIGIACTALVALSFSPAALAVLREAASPALSAGSHGGRLISAMRRLGEFDVRHRRAILATGALVALGSLLLVPRILVSTDLIRNFTEDSEIVRATATARRHMGAVDQIYAVIEAPTDDAFLRPENLVVVEAVQAWIDEQPEIGGSTSLSDYVKLVNRGMNGDADEFHAIPPDQQTVSQLLLVGHTEQLDRLVDPQYRLTSILLRIDVTGSEQVGDLSDRIDARLAEIPAPLVGRVTGNPVLVARTSDEITFGQAASLGSAFLIIFVILSILFTSLRVGALAMLPNVLPVLIYFGALGISGISLNLTTGSVACMVLGIAVDDTIHFLTRFNAIARARGDEQRAVPEALAEVGPPVTFTSIALCIGFGILATASMQSLADFGLLAAFTLGVAWLADVTFTPALAAGMRIVTLWDIAALDLGPEPERAVPLFRGLSRGQARITALMCRMVEHSAGERLIRSGDRAEGMYLVLDGRLVSSTAGGAHSARLNVHERGDVIGEVGVLRGTRTADVDCETDVRLLLIDTSSLERLRRRYPRTAAQVYRNLSGVLAERLDRVTRRLA
ncbi:MAG: MMPL family transporter [Deltaproteobacteria bacterium]|nr:MMPL family transporter [Deltaproteobacteria bacterium]MBW2362410.1 MMPL family transporter [Deltaproteobacteria bacterium]